MKKTDVFGIIVISIFTALILSSIIGDSFLYSEYANEKCRNLGNDYGTIYRSDWFDDEMRLSCRKIKSNGEVIRSYPYVLKEVNQK